MSTIVRQSVVLQSKSPIQCGRCSCSHCGVDEKVWIIRKCWERSCPSGRLGSSPLPPLYYNSSRPRSRPVACVSANDHRKEESRGDNTPSKPNRPIPAPALQSQSAPRSISSSGPYNLARKWKSCPCNLRSCQKSVGPSRNPTPLPSELQRRAR